MCAGHRELDTPPPNQPRESGTGRTGQGIFSEILNYALPSSILKQVTELLEQESNCEALGGHKISWSKRGETEDKCGWPRPALSHPSVRIWERYSIILQPARRAACYHLLSSLRIMISTLAGNFPSSLSDNKRICKYQWLEMFNCLKHYWFVGCSKFSRQSGSCFRTVSSGGLVRISDATIQ